jgi:hypothetical protein
VQNEYTLSIAPVSGVRYVRIQLVGTNFLTLAEVEVYAHSGNVALSKSTSQTSNFYTPLGLPVLGVDGKNGGDWFGGSVTGSYSTTTDNNWQVDLATDFSVSKVVVYNRADTAPERLNPFQIILKDSAGNALRSMTFSSTQPQYTLTIPTHGVRTVSAQLSGSEIRPLSVAEVEVFSLGTWTAISTSEFKTCSGCYKDLFAGKYNYCNDVLPEATKTGCAESGGPGCTFTPETSVSLSACKAKCDNEPGCTFFTSYWNSICNLHFMSVCTYQNTQGDGTVYKRI